MGIAFFLWALSLLQTVPAYGASSDDSCADLLHLSSDALLEAVEQKLSDLPAHENPYWGAWSVTQLVRRRAELETQFPLLAFAKWQELSPSEIPLFRQKIIERMREILLQDVGKTQELWALREALGFLATRSSEAPQAKKIETQDTVPIPPPPRMEIKNKEIQNQEAEETQLRIETTAPQVEYWAMTRLENIDFDQGLASVKSPTRAAVGLSPIVLTPQRQGLYSLTLTAASGAPLAMPVSIPDGYMPQLHEKNLAASIREQFLIRDGGEIIWMRRNGQSSVQIPLNKAKIITGQTLTDSPPLPIAAFPQSLKEWIQKNPHLDGRTPSATESLARSLESVIRSSFQYTKQADGVQSLTERIRSGKIQCDSAAALMVWILRTHYKINSHIVVGYHTAPASKSLLELPATGHAWVEAFSGLEYLRFDPTPSETSQNTAPQENPSEVSSTRDSPQNPPSTPAAETEKDKPKRLPPQSQNLARQEPGENGGDPSLAPAQPHLTHLQNALRNTLLAWITEPSLAPILKRERVQNVREAVSRQRNFRSHAPLALALPHEKGELQILAESYGRPERASELGIFEEIIQTLVGLPQSSLTDSFARLLRLQQELNLHLSYLQVGSSAPAEWGRLRNSLVGFLKALEPLSDSQAQLKRTVAEFQLKLPGTLSSAYVKQTFPTDQELYQALLSTNTSLFGRTEPHLLDSIRLSSLLARSAWIDGQPQLLPRGEQGSLWRKSQGREKGVLSLLPARDPREKKTGISLNPMLSPETAWHQGQVFIQAPRQSITLPDGWSKLEPSQTLVVLCDVSASMNGIRAEFMRSWIMALLDRALSPRASGQPQFNQIWILPFDTTVGDPIRIQATDPYAKILPSFTQMLPNQTGGTDLTHALLTGAERITSAIQAQEPGIQRATLAMISDGDGVVDHAQIEAAFKKVAQLRKGLELHFGFLALGRGNPAIQKLSETFNGLGHPFYQFWSDTEIQAIIHRSRQAPLPESPFWTKNSWSEAVTQIPRISQLREDLIRDSRSASHQSPFHFLRRPEVSKSLQEKLTEGEREILESLVYLTPMMPSVAQRRVFAHRYLDQLRATHYPTPHALWIRTWEQWIEAGGTAP